MEKFSIVFARLQNAQILLLKTIRLPISAKIGSRYAA